MEHMDVVEMAMPSTGAWAPGDLALVFVMWAVMMAAMMVPAALPMLLTHRRVVTMRRLGPWPGALTGAFLLGYLAVWTGFSALASAAQWMLHGARLISPGMAVTSSVLGGVLLMAAGLYQWSALKHRCLARCRGLLDFLATEWRDGLAGALAMGLRHGLYCVGCCWVLMAMLFAVGVMNLWWIAGLSLLVLVEKVARGGQWLGRASGLLLIAWGAWVLA
jgi:predicted metal-binding membrane protein